MEGLILVAILIGLAIIIGTVVSFVNLSSISSLREETRRLNKIVELQKQQLTSLFKHLESLSKASKEAGSDKASSVESREASQQSEQLKQSFQANSTIATTAPTEDNKQIVESREVDADFEEESPTNSSTPDITPKQKALIKSFDLEKFMMGNGLLWLGGIVLAFGGVFLAKYSIEAGLFPPALRIVLGAAFGVSLVVAAEYLFQHPKRFQINTPVISAALASGGIITCFAMTYVAFDFYSFLSPLFAFALLAIIALVGTVLSLRYGPILALIGVIGAYTIPVLVSTGSNNVFALLSYVAFVSSCAVWTHSQVKETWLWWLALAGNMAWLFISIAVAEANHVWVIFVFSVLSIYLYIVVPVLGWRLSQTHFSALPLRTLLVPRKEQLGIFLPVIAIAFVFAGFAYQTDFLVMLFIICAILLAMPLRHSAFDTWPYLALVLVVVTYFVMPSDYLASDNLFPFTHGYLLIQVCSLAAIAYCMFLIKTFPLRPSFLVLLVLAPLGLMGMAYALSPDEHATFLYPLWSIELMATAAIFAFLAIRTDVLMHKMTFLLLANGALTLTLTMLLSPSVLSLAVVIQVALMSFLSRQYNLVLPSWIYKIAITAVILRLSLAPWLDAYADEQLFGLHWSLVIYPLVIAVLYLANTYHQNDTLKTWCKGAMLHVLALFVTTETSYLMSGRYPVLGDLSYYEYIMLSMNWLLLSGLYLWRARLSHAGKSLTLDNLGSMSLKTKAYTAYAMLLGAGAALFQVNISFINNPFIAYQETGQHLLVNWLFLMWAVPAIVLFAGLRFSLISNRFTKPAWLGIAVFAVMYINGLIRGAYHPMLSFDAAPIEQQELYVYSLVWLVISVATIVVGHNKGASIVYKIGFVVLALVVLKAFLVDMANLDGLYRAVSFIGLGLSLVGIGWLFQRLNAQAKMADN